MKRILLLSAISLILASCSLHKANVATRPVYSPEVETLTLATLDVSPKKISFRYIPEKHEAKRLSVDQLVNNAIYAALRENGNADELIEVNYYISGKFSFFGKKVRSIYVSGYPAYYVNFREPSKSELEAVETLSRSKMLRRSQIRSISIDKL